MWACEMPLASSVRARRTARLLPRASITTTFALGRSCARHPSQHPKDTLVFPLMSSHPRQRVQVTLLPRASITTTFVFGHSRARHPLSTPRSTLCLF